MTLGIYFIDQYNYPQLCDNAESGDTLARDLVRALSGFIDRGPPPVCSICSRRVPAPHVPTMTIAVFRTDRATLSTWICEDCAVRDDLDQHVEKLIRAWPEIPSNAIIEIMKKGTVH